MPYRRCEVNSPAGIDFGFTLGGAERVDQIEYHGFRPVILGAERQGQGKAPGEALADCCETNEGAHPIHACITSKPREKGHGALTTAYRVISISVWPVLALTALVKVPRPGKCQWCYLIQQKRQGRTGVHNDVSTISNFSRSESSIQYFRSEICTLAYENMRRL